MICQKCGSQVADGQQVCGNCGAPVGAVSAPTTAGDASSIGFAILCFFIPLLGLILFLVWKDQSPLKAKSCGKGALAGVITWFVVGCLVSVLTIVLAGSLASLY
jgi:hypothetical protein